jgi:hypothetical protein
MPVGHFAVRRILVKCMVVIRSAAARELDLMMDLSQPNSQLIDAIQLFIYWLPIRIDNEAKIWKNVHSARFELTTSREAFECCKADTLPLR